MQGVPKQVLLGELPSVSGNCEGSAALLLVYEHTDSCSHNPNVHTQHQYTNTHMPPTPHSHPHLYMQLLPLLLESLQCSEAGLRVSTLEGLLSLIHDAPQVISEHVPTLVPRLLELARAPESMVECVF